MIQVKRIYEPYSPSDGFRVLVDRLWPRGVSKEKARIDLWMKDIAPSSDLRKWFGHDVPKWEEFIRRYKKELHEKQALLEQIKGLEKQHEVVTLLFAARDTDHNEAVVLTTVLQSSQRE